MYRLFRLDVCFNAFKTTPCANDSFWRFPTYFDVNCIFFSFFISSLWYKLCQKQNIIDDACWIISINLCFDLFWPTILDYDKNKTSLGFFGRVILIFEGKINSTDGAKSEHCYALCSRIRLGFESKMWYLDVLKICCLELSL